MRDSETVLNILHGGGAALSIQEIFFLQRHTNTKECLHCDRIQRKHFFYFRQWYRLDYKKEKFQKLINHIQS